LSFMWTLSFVCAFQKPSAGMCSNRTGTELNRVESDVFGTPRRFRPGSMSGHTEREG
jgi:hypothetical protein